MAGTDFPLTHSQ